MDEAKARQILGDWIQPEGRLNTYHPPTVSFPVRIVPGKASLHGLFTADQLEAIAWWMREKGAK